MARAHPSPLRVLVTAASAPDAEAIEALLAADPGEGFRVTLRAFNADETMRGIEGGEADLAVIDLAAASGREMEFIEASCGVLSPLPVVALTGARDEELAIAAMQAGAQDCLSLDGLSPALLHQAMRHAIERARVEMALARERAQLHALLDFIPDRIYFKDRDSRFLRASTALVRFFGADSPGGVIGRTDFDFFTREHAQQAFEDEQRVMRTGEPIIGKIEKETLPDGRIGWAQTTKLPLRDRDSAIIGTCGISRDITELKTLEDTLAAERNLLRNVIDNLPDPIFVKDAAGRYLVSNVAHARLLGADGPQDVIGRTAADFVPVESAKVFRDAEDEVFRTGEPQLNREEEIALADHSTRWVVTTRVPLLDGRGRVRTLACIGRDITEQRREHRELEAANASLSAALADLKQTHEQLHAVQLHLIDAEKMKSIGRLAAGVAHEVKNPLAIISMGLEFLKSQTYQQPEVPDVLRDIEEAMRRANSVIEGMLDFSAPRKLELEPHDLNAVVRSALVLVKGEARAGKLQIRTELGETPRVRLDRLKIEQVLINLFTNAIHAMAGAGSLTVRTRCEQITGVGPNAAGTMLDQFRAGDRVVIVEIDDTGPGIPEQRIGRIFEPFYTTKPAGQGTGLGLSVAKSIIDLHSGMIEVANRDGGGLRVRLVFRT